MVDAIHIHEDDWGLRVLYPLAARGDALAELGASRDAAERNRDPSGFGWTDMHVIQPPSISYVDVGLGLADAAAALAPIMPRVKIFNATIGGAIGSDRRDPYGSYETEAWCFAQGPHCFVKLEPEDSLVRDIWFELDGEDPGTAAALRTAIEALDGLAPSVIVDYRRGFAGPVGDPAFLDAYFSDL